MSVERLMVQPLTIQTVGSSTDIYGDQVPANVGSPVSVTGYLEQSSTTETLVDRDTVVTSWKAYLPAGTAINYLDFITFEGQKFQVNGAPWKVFNPRTRAVSHIELELVVVNG